jgi:hypothetical protein
LLRWRTAGFVGGNFKIQIAFPEIFPLPGGVGVTSVGGSEFDGGKAPLL